MKTKISEQIKDLLKDKKIQIKSTGSIHNQVFKILGDKKILSKIGIEGLVLNIVISIGRLIFKAVSGTSQDMICDGIMKTESGLFLVGRCLQMNKPGPKENGRYHLSDDHDYDMDFFQKLDVDFNYFFIEMGCRFGLSGGTDYRYKISYYKQIITWINNDSPEPYQIIKKLYGERSFFTFTDIYELLKADFIYNRLKRDATFSKKLFLILEENINNGKIDNHEKQILKNIGLISTKN